MTVTQIEVPAFTDWHVHLSLVDHEIPASSPIARVLDLGANPETIAETASSASALFAGAFLTAPGGYPSDRAWAADGSWRFVAEESDAAVHVAEMAAAGASVIKVSLNSAAGPVLSDTLLRKIKVAAASHGLPVVAHAEGPGEAERARECGADYLAHTPFTEELSDEEIRLQAQSVVWISTLDIHGWGTPDEHFAIAISNLTRFAKAGGLVLYGTDMGNGPTVHGLNPREIAALQRAGLSDEQILRALTGPAPGIATEISDARVLIPVVDGRLNFIDSKILTKSRE